jgi:hypothetical protein
MITCKSCTSMCTSEFVAEICMHFKGGVESLGKPIIWVFPSVVVCLECGYAEFSVPETELNQCQLNS